jgi:hypothetical protein
MKVKDLKTDATYELISYKSSAQRSPSAIRGDAYIPNPPTDVDISMRLDNVIYSVSFTKYFGDSSRFEFISNKGEVFYL